jgi:hypothetical protein
MDPAELPEKRVVEMISGVMAYYRQEEIFTFPQASRWLRDGKRLFRPISQNHYWITSGPWFSRGPAYRRHLFIPKPSL